ncbi:MAG: hypothetical protein NC432_13060 [Roseburia sp.]|nr:hypothetical protein [Roseburia sp.]MCM1098596.1 hypothetical protein [Ruminococcus flavefaciens]MCM1233644.1 hypothetical protein [Ruminococcus flavefaciens]
MKKWAVWGIGLLLAAIFFGVGYSIFREEWYFYRREEISEFINCTQKDISEIYADVVAELGEEVRGYDLAEAVFTLDGGLEQIDFLFYKPGIFYDVNTKRITIFPRENRIQSIEIYQGNFKASEVDSPVIPISAEELDRIYRENAGEEGVKKVICDGDGVRVYQKD